VSEAGEHLELLKNAVRQSIAALTAVETDTVYQAKELAKMLAAEIGERPHETLSLSVDAGASQLLYQARRISENWADEEGVLFIIDDGGKDEGKRYPFWVEMNGLRESWAAINCHVIFFLLPHNYRMLLQVGDHLADWISLRLRLMSASHPEPVTYDKVLTENILSANRLSKEAARQQLSILEKQLAEELQKGAPDVILIRRFYLPIFEAVVELSQLNRAQILREKISETDVPYSDLPRWWSINFILDSDLNNLDIAENWAKKLFEWAVQKDNLKWKSEAFYMFGRIAEKEKKFETAKEWYKKSCEVKEKNGDKIGITRCYHNLGRIAWVERNFEMAENWYKKAFEIRENEDHFGIAVSYYRLGRIAEDRHNFEKAEEYYLRSIEICQKIGSENNITANYYRLGVIAEKKRNFETAEGWYQKSLIINEKRGDEHGLSFNYYDLGILARQQERLESSGEWLIKSIKAFTNTNDPENAEKAKDEFQKTYAQASPDVQVKLKEMWDAAGLSEP